MEWNYNLKQHVFFLKFQSKLVMVALEYTDMLFDLSTTKSLYQQ